MATSINIPCIIPGEPGVGSYTIASTDCKVPSDYIDYINGGCPAKQNQEGINPMRYSDAPQVASSVLAVSGSPSVEATKRDFLTQRIHQTMDRLGQDLRIQFKMDAHDRPQTAKELIKAIEDGDYILDEKTIENAGEDIIHYNNEYGMRKLVKY